jgi:hypothetical protein
LFYKSSLKKTGEKVCRFCKKNHKETRFTKDAHLIPRSFGNRHYLWDEECDQCNTLFNRFETDFSYFLGMEKTFSDIRKGDKFPTFCNVDGTIKATRVNEEIIALERLQAEHGFEFDREKAIWTIETSPKPYRPGFIYNILLKIALSILPPVDVKDYEWAYRYLIDAENYSNLQGPRMVRVAKASFGYEYPFAILFKRIRNDPSYPMHVTCIYMRNLMFQIVLPLFQACPGIESWKCIEMPAPFVDFTCKAEEPIEIRRWLIDLHSLEKEYRPDKIKAQFEHKVLENLISVPLPEGVMDHFFK